MARVAKRVSQGGHNIPTDVILRRYEAGLNNLFQLYMPVVDYWSLYDNSSCPSEKVACGWKDSRVNIIQPERYAELLANYNTPTQDE